MKGKNKRSLRSSCSVKVKRVEGDSKSSGSKGKDDELSTKEMLKILMQSQERTMEIALKAAISPSKKDEDEMKLKRKKKEIGQKTKE